jgi:hypothetical protein
LEPCRTVWRYFSKILIVLTAARVVSGWSRHQERATKGSKTGLFSISHRKREPERTKTALEVFASAATNFKVMRVERHFGRLGKGMMDSAHRAISANLHFDKTPARLPCLDGTVVRPVSLVQSHVEFLSPLGRWAKAKRFSPVG